MLKNYTDFIKMNEAQDEFGGTSAAKGIGGLFKNLLGGLLKDVKDEFKKPIEDLNKKLGQQKGADNMAKLVNKYLIQHRDTLTKSMEEVKSVPDLLTIVEDNIRSAYASIGASIQNLGTDKYTFEEIYKDAPERTKKLFSKDAKKFDKNVDQFSKDLILSLGKPFGVTKEDLEQTPEDAKKENEQEQIQTAAPTEGVEATEHLHKNYKDKLFEQVDEEGLKKLKETIINWFDDTIYKNNKTKLEVVEKEGGKPQTTGNIDAKLDAIPDEVTRNKDSVKNMANKLADLDKETLIKVRDLLGLTKEDTPL